MVGRVERRLADWTHLGIVHQVDSPNHAVCLTPDPTALFTFPATVDHPAGVWSAYRGVLAILPPGVCRRTCRFCTMVSDRSMAHTTTP